MAKPKSLNDDQVVELKRRYQLWEQNTPAKLAAEFGVTRNTLRAYVTDAHRSTHKGTWPTCSRVCDVCGVEYPSVMKHFGDHKSWVCLECKARRRKLRAPVL